MTLVARVIAKLEPGGAQLGALRLTHALRRHRIETRLLVGSATPEGVAMFARAGLEVDVWGGGPADMQYECEPEFAAWLAPWVAAADLVHAHMLGAWWAAGRATPIGVPLVASEHNSIRWRRALEPEARAALVRVDRFLAHGPQAREFAIARGLSEDRIADGISIIDPRVPEPDRSLARRRIVFAGRLHEEKGPDLLLDALALMAKPVPCYLLGSGPMEADLRERARRLEIAERVRFCGWQDDPGRWLRRASACVVPSRHESWSQTAVQAMALGTPVVGTDVEGLPDTLGSGRGLIVPADDPQALAAALDDVVARRRLGDLAAARRYALGFLPEAVAARYAGLYAALIDHRRAAAAVISGRRRRRLARPAIAVG